MKLTKIIGAVALIAFSISVYAADPIPTKWDNYIDGKHYSVWYYISGQMPGPLTYESNLDSSGAQGNVVVYFTADNTYTSAQEKTTLGTTCLYDGNVTKDSSGRPNIVNGTAVCSDNDAHEWMATLYYPQKKLDDNLN